MQRIDDPTAHFELYAREFVSRHIGPTAREQEEMLRALGRSSLDRLLDDVVPRHIASRSPLDLPGPRSERDVLSSIRAIAGKNKVYKSYLGMGYHGTLLPAVILRNLLENPAWYTAYTPYQAEISQGRLEALLNFQTMVSDLTGLEIANASLLDEATAAAEAMMLARRNAGSRGNAFLVSSLCHPQTLSVLRTRAERLGIELLIEDEFAGRAPPVFGVLLQYPASTGALHDYRALVARYRTQGAVVIVAADLLGLTLLVPPGELGADIAVGTTQRFGVPMGFGGPHAAYFACREKFKRQIPGRLVGVSIDALGNPAYRLTLQTREQHIRRERATSNICTSQVLLAVIAGMYAVYHGPDGLRRIASRIHQTACVFAEGARQLGYRLRHDSFFDTVALAAEPGDALVRRARKRSLNLRRADSGTVCVTLDETTTPGDVETLWAVLADAGASPLKFSRVPASSALPGSLARTSPFLAHPVFHMHQSETSMLRYLRLLADKDLALDRTMIPLGSCTMKLNATTELIPITWPEFADMHPYAPADQCEGYRELTGNLERALCEITGYDAVSLQPNSGAQGELAGLLAIQAYHRSRGDTQRRVALIPSSAHGTNPASAQAAGMETVVVACDEAGNVDIEDLKRQASRHAQNLAALMITYPSTHGVFEDGIAGICDIVHAYGGQIFLDGANMNALVGVARPGKFGADVSQLNLHKTFCVPHGGGGPGVGPIAVRAHLAPFLPAHPLAADGSAVGPVSAAPYGNAGILPISWAYIALMGAAGLAAATRVAILSANYMAARLAPYYPILYANKNGLVAHECILDVRPLKEKCGIAVEDIAKRLIDHGFHAPTMSFPVPGTLMVEPTESESKREIDRFIDAMISIRKEIDAIADGRLDRHDNPLRNAPHTAAMLTADDWPHGYSRQVAAYPLPSIRNTKYWPPVARIDNEYGDRNVFCACPPLTAYEETAVPSVIERAANGNC